MATLRGMRADEGSETARRVAAQRLGFERIAVPYGDAEADDRLAGDVAGSVPSTSGVLTGYLEARTRFFDGVVVRALDREVDQIVIGAAGYDGRALRYAKPGVRWFEVDHPATQADKLARLAALGVCTNHIVFVPADFGRDPLGPGLLDAGLVPSVPSLFVLEGVAVYLPRHVLDSVLRQLSDLAAPESQLAISLSAAPSSTATPRREAFQSAVAALGEPALTVILPDEAAEFPG